MSVRELGLENDGQIVDCEVTGGSNRWVRCTHCRNHRGCRVCNNGDNLAGTLYRMWGRDHREDGGPANLLLYVGITRGGRSTRLAAHTEVWLSDVMVVTLEHYWDETALRFAETEAIHTEHPRHNRTWQRQGKTARLSGLSRLAVRR